MKTYYDNVPKEENTALHVRSFKTGDGVQKLVASMSDDLDLSEWQLHTLKDMKWNDNHQCNIKYWSRDIIESIEWLMLLRAYAEHHIYAPQHYFNSNTPLKHLYNEMHIADSTWETQIKRDIPG
jgi:hypothetical protein